jgi:putative aminopeptidase FrvX
MSYAPNVSPLVGDLLDTLKLLIRHPSVVSAEHSFFRVLQRELEEIGVTVTWYEGVLVAQGNKPDAHYMSAHIDRHGLICTGPNEFQYAAYIAGNRGDLIGNSVSEQMFTTLSERFSGATVTAYEPWSGVYRGKGQIERAYLCPQRGNMVFEVKGLEHVVAGTPVAFQDSVRIREGRISAQLDNVFSAAVLVSLFRAGYQGTAFFTAQEEAGRSWRFLMEWFQRFNKTTRELIVLDTSPYATTEESDEQALVLRRRDANGEFEPSTVQELEDICTRLEISYGYKDDYIVRKNEQRQAEGKSLYSLGSTEMGRIVSASKGVIQGATLQVPTTGYHTTEETVSLASCEALMRVLKHYAIETVH